MGTSAAHETYHPALSPKSLLGFLWPIIQAKRLDKIAFFVQIGEHILLLQIYWTADILSRFIPLQPVIEY